MKQITLSDRIVIEAGICTGKSIKKISEDIGKNPSTVSREIRTNRSFIRGSFYLNNDCKYACYCAKNTFVQMIIVNILVLGAEIMIVETVAQSIFRLNAAE